MAYLLWVFRACAGQTSPVGLVRVLRAQRPCFCSTARLDSLVRVLWRIRGTARWDPGNRRNKKGSEDASDALRCRDRYCIQHIVPSIQHRCGDATAHRSVSACATRDQSRVGSLERAAGGRSLHPQHRGSPAAVNQLDRDLPAQRHLHQHPVLAVAVGSRRGGRARSSC